MSCVGEENGRPKTLVKYDGERRGQVEDDGSECRGKSSSETTAASPDPDLFKLTMQCGCGSGW